VIASNDGGRGTTSPSDDMSFIAVSRFEDVQNRDARRRFSRQHAYDALRESRHAAVIQSEDTVNKSLVMGSVLGAIVVSAGGAFAGIKLLASANGAEVINAKEIHKTIKTPRQECHDEQVTRTKPAKDTNRLVGTGLGAVVGGLLGNEVGGGNGKVLATVAGAAAGGYAGNKIEQKVQQGNTYSATEHRCTTVYDTAEIPAGYEVVYVLDGKEHHAHLDHDPGKTIPVKDGRIVTEQ
jgi:uncharacterized protein YcfJ